MENNPNDFDSKARAWDSDPRKIQRAKTIADSIKKNVPLQDTFSAFEYGCGTDLLSFALQPYFSRIVLADNSKGMLEVVREKIDKNAITNMEPMELDLTSGTIPEERFDVVYSMMALHHIPNTEKVVQHFFTLLKSPGYVCISDLDKEDGSFHGQGYKGHKGFDRDELTRLASSIGFSDIHFETVTEVAKQTDSGETRTYPVFFMIARKK